MDAHNAIVPAGGGGLDARKAADLFAEWFGGLTPATRRNYAQDLAAFAAHAGAADNRAAAVLLCSASPLDARSLALGFKAALREKCEAPSTINRRLASLRSLYRHAVGAPLVIVGVKAARRRRTPPGNGSTVAALIGAARGGDGEKALRDVALLLVLHDSGLRRSEVASLRVRDLDLEARQAWIVGKGRQGEREAQDLSAPAVEAIKTYLAVRGALDPAAPAFASCDRAGKGKGGLTADGIHAILTALSRRAGLSHRIAPHDMRRLGARALAKAGADAEMLRRWGRWSNYEIPARYVGEILEKAREAVDLLAQVREATA